MERLRGVFDHPLELVVHEGWNQTLCHKVANGLYGVAETEQEHCRGALDEVLQGKRLSLGKLRHDIGEREGEVAQVLPGRLGSQEDTELMLQPPIVEVKELATSMGVGL